MPPDTYMHMCVFVCACERALVLFIFPYIKFVSSYFVCNVAGILKQNSPLEMRNYLLYELNVKGYCISTIY